MADRDREAIRSRNAFYVLPRRWVLKRTFAWLNRNRRLAKDFEITVASSQAWVYRAIAKFW